MKKFKWLWPAVYVTTWYIWNHEGRHFHVFHDDVKTSYTRSAAQRKPWSAVGAYATKKCLSWWLCKFLELTIKEHIQRKGKKEERYVLKQEEIQKIMDTKNYGLDSFFCIVSKCESDSFTALGTYRGAWQHRKIPPLNTVGNGCGYIQRTSCLAKFICFFWQVSYWIVCFKQETGNKRNVTVPGSIDQLEMIECARSAQGCYRRRYALTANRLHRSWAWLGRWLTEL